MNIKVKSTVDCHVLLPVNWTMAWPELYINIVGHLSRSPAKNMRPNFIFLRLPRLWINSLIQDVHTENNAWYDKQHLRPWTILRGKANIVKLQFLSTSSFPRCTGCDVRELSERAIWPHLTLPADTFVPSWPPPLPPHACLLIHTYSQLMNNSWYESQHILRGDKDGYYREYSVELWPPVNWHLKYRPIVCCYPCDYLIW